MDASKKSKVNVLPARLNRPAEFRHTTSKGRRYRHDFLSIYISPASDPAKGGRIGFIVTDRAVKGAVKRNRVRRMLKEAVRKWWRCIQPGYDIVLKAGVFPKINNGNYVESVVVKAFIKARIFTVDGADRAKEFMSGEGAGR